MFRFFSLLNYNVTLQLHAPGWDAGTGGGDLYLVESTGRLFLLRGTAEAGPSAKGFAQSAARERLRCCKSCSRSSPLFPVVPRSLATVLERVSAVLCDDERDAVSSLVFGLNLGGPKTWKASFKRGVMARRPCKWRALCHGAWTSTYRHPEQRAVAALSRCAGVILALFYKVSGARLDNKKRTQEHQNIIRRT